MRPLGQEQLYRCKRALQLNKNFEGDFNWHTTLKSCATQRLNFSEFTRLDLYGTTLFEAMNAKNWSLLVA